MAPRVSVILASYQHAPYVEVAVRSVLAQTMSDLELIVVDDGSSDGTPEIVGAIKDPRLRLVRSSLNRRFHVRNHGLSLARGSYIAFQNSDDEWYPDKLAKQFDAFDREPSLGACFSQAERMDAEGKCLALPLGGEAPDLVCARRRGEDWLYSLFCANSLVLSSALIRADLMRSLGGFRASFVQVADWELWVRLAARTSLCVLPERLVRLRNLGEQNLGSATPEKLALHMGERLHLLELYASSPIFERLPTVFPALAKEEGADPRLSMARLCCSMLKMGGIYQAFADRVLGRYFDDPEARELIVSTLGVSVLRLFWSNRTLLGNRFIK